MPRRRPLPPPGRIRAVRYLRMSSRPQIYSLETQAAVIDAYALTRGYEIIGTYRDAGKSGLRADIRTGFRELLATVLGGQADFQVILVYDISRWGRFQDPDEAGHYEFLCLQEGVRVEYCAEMLGPPGSAAEALLKGLKRAVAAESSRDFARKVRDGKALHATRGHWQSGSPGYGLRRQFVDAAGTPREIMQPGERKALREGHTILVLGPPEEQAVVRDIHRRFTVEGRSIAAIAKQLNAAGVLAEHGAKWTFPRVRQVLANPKYVGDLVARQRTAPLGGCTRRRPEADWIVDALPASLDRATFAATQAALAERQPPSEASLLAILEEIAHTHGVIGEGRLRRLGVRHWRSYRQRFGSLRAAFAALGHIAPARSQKRLADRELLRRLAALALLHGEISCARITAAPELPCVDVYRRRFGSIAAAQALIGYVRLSATELASPVGQARHAARQARLRAWAGEIDDVGYADGDSNAATRRTLTRT